MSIYLDPLEGADVEDLRIWRNLSRLSFFDSRLISQQQQTEWYWNSYLMGRGPRIFTIKTYGERIGFIGFTRHSRYDAPVQKVEVGPLILSPDHMGRGVMTAALVELRFRFQRGTLWFAHVKPDNHASLRLFEKAGFIKLRPRRTSCRKTTSHRKK